MKIPRLALINSFEDYVKARDEYLKYCHSHSDDGCRGCRFDKYPIDNDCWLSFIAEDVEVSSQKRAGWLISELLTIGMIGDDSNVIYGDDKPIFSRINIYLSDVEEENEKCSD